MLRSTGIGGAGRPSPRLKSGESLCSRPGSRRQAPPSAVSQAAAASSGQERRRGRRDERGCLRAGRLPNTRRAMGRARGTRAGARPPRRARAASPISAGWAAELAQQGVRDGARAARAVDRRARAAACEPTNGSDAWRMPATMAASSTPAPPARRAARARGRTAPRAAAAPSAAERREQRRRPRAARPARASRQREREPQRRRRSRRRSRGRARCSRAGRTRRRARRARPSRGAAKPSAAPSRGEARAASRRDRTGRAEATQPAASAGQRGGQHALRCEQRHGRAGSPSRREPPACGAGASAASAARRPAARRVGRRCGLQRRGRSATVSRTWSGRSGRSVCERRGAVLDPPRRLDQVAAPERVLARERLPEDDADGPDVGGRGGRLALQALRRDVGERAGDVAERGQRVELRHLRETEVEQPHVDLAGLAVDPWASRTFDGFTSRWTMPRPCACASASQICAATSIAPRSSSSPARIASRSVRPGDVLVGDVDVGRVTRQREDALAAGMAERGRGAGLALGAMAAPCPRARRSSARRRARSARRGPARRGPSRRSPAAGSAGSGRGRGHAQQPPRPPSYVTRWPGHFLSEPNRTL